MKRPLADPITRIDASAAPGAALYGLVQVSDGSLEALKWLAAVLMVGDHVNRHLYEDRLPWLFEAGRLAFPIFAFVLASHLARTNLPPGAEGRTARRMLISGAVATLPFAMLVGWWPLNIMFALALATGAIALQRRPDASRATVAVLLVLGGFWVEFWWPAALTVIAAWHCIRRTTLANLALWVTAVASLSLINGNHWALASFGMIAIASRVDVPFPRWRTFFYVFYPAHLAVIALARHA